MTLSTRIVNFVRQHWLQVSWATKHAARWGSLVLVALLASGCALFGGMVIEPVAVTSSTTAQVAVFAAVRNGDEPVTGLSENDFELEEDGIPLDSRQVQLTLLPRDGVVEHHLLILVDMSGPVDDPGTRALLVRQLSSFIARAQAHYSVSLFGFDGSPQLTALGSYRKQANAAAPALERLSAVPQKDPSSNLHGAMTTGLNQLTANLAASHANIGLGTMLVIARGPDLAGRTSRKELLKTMGSSNHRILALTTGTWGKDEAPDELGPDGHATAPRFESLEEPLSELARNLEEDHAHYYLVSYCSPARAGGRSLLVRVHHQGKDGKSKEAQAYTEFSADGFTGKCNPRAVPRFHKPRSSGGVTTVAPDEAAPTPTVVSKDSAKPAQASEAPDEDEPIAPPPNSNYAQ
jgi:hypothetical protein